MNLPSNEILYAMKVLATAMVDKPLSETSLILDVDNELLKFRYGDVVRCVNCAGDSTYAIIKDFAKQLILKA